MRFSLRTLLVVLTLLCVTLGVRWNQLHRQQQAVDAIRFSGGLVLYTGENWPALPGTLQHGQSAWLAEFAGIRKPVEARLAGKAITDDVLQQLVLPLKSLERLDLSDVSVTDQGLTQLKALKSLTDLGCFRNKANAAAFRDLQKPSFVDCKDCPLTDLLAQLSDFHQMPIVADEKDLAAAGIDPFGYNDADLISDTMMRKPLADTLDAILAPHGMDWLVVKGGVVVLSRATAKRARRHIEELQQALPGLRCEVGYDHVP